MKLQKVFVFVFTLVVALVMAGCHHQQQPVAKVNTPPPTPTAPSPAASLTVTPATVDHGQSAKLSWQTQNATTINIDGVGPVTASGSMNVMPSDSTTYHLTAKGDGGNTEASARITVNAKKIATGITDEQLFAQNVKDIFFAYDNYQISAEQEAALNADAEFLAQHPSMKLVIEGHCDERGSEDYNMGLGDNRANIVRDILAKHGVTGDRVHTISFGKERPFCTKSEDESCWKENRRAHFVLQKQQIANN